MNENNNPNIPKKPFLKKGQGKLVCNNINNKNSKLNKNKSELSSSYLKKGQGRLAWHHNESDKSSQLRQDTYELEQGKIELKEYNTQQKKSLIENIRNKYKKDVEFVDTIQTRIKELESWSKDKLNYTF